MGQKVESAQFDPNWNWEAINVEIDPETQKEWFDEGDGEDSRKPDWTGQICELGGAERKR